jgi:hypothetical protein
VLLGLQLIKVLKWFTLMEQMLLTQLSQNYHQTTHHTLSGILDTNGNDIVVDTGGAIEDDSNNEYIKFVKTATAVNEVTITNQATGSAPSIAATGDDTNIDFNLTPKGIGRVTLNGNGKIQGLAEKVLVNGTFTSNINIDTNTQAVQLNTATASANFTVNLRGDGSNSLDASMDTGESITVAYINKNNNVTYWNTTVQVDGVTVTPVWQGGAAPTGGNVTSNDVYTYTAIKTGAATFHSFSSTNAVRIIGGY